MVFPLAILTTFLLTGSRHLGFILNLVTKNLNIITALPMEQNLGKTKSKNSHSASHPINFVLNLAAPFLNIVTLLPIQPNTRILTNQIKPTGWPMETVAFPTFRVYKASGSIHHSLTASPEEGVDRRKFVKLYHRT